MDYVEVKVKDPRWAKPVCEGWMNKFTMTFGKVKWRKRYFILNEDGNLFYFKNDNSEKPCKVFVEVNGKRYREANVMICCIEIERDNKPFLFFAEKYQEFVKWMKILEEVGGLRDNPVDGDKEKLYTKKFSSEIFSFQKKEKRRREGGGGVFASPYSCEDITPFDDVCGNNDGNRRSVKLELDDNDKGLFNIKFEEIKDIKLSRVCYDGSYAYNGIWNDKPITLNRYESKDLYGAYKKDEYVKFVGYLNLLKTLDHPGIPKFLGCYHEDPQIGYVTENVKNGSVKKIVTKDTIAHPQKLEISKRLCDIMEYIHSKMNIIHSSMNWENVVLDDDLSPKLTGFYKSIRVDPSLDRRRSVALPKVEEGDGTNIYLAPERVSSTYGYPSDIYSFGVMLYTIFTEDFQPYGVDNDVNVELQASLKSDFRPPIDRKESIVKYHPMLVHTMKQCWNADPKKRPTWKEIKFGLQNSDKKVEDVNFKMKNEEVEGEEDDDDEAEKQSVEIEKIEIEVIE